MMTLKLIGLYYIALIMWIIIILMYTSIVLLPVIYFLRSDEGKVTWWMCPFKKAYEVWDDSFMKW